MLFLTRDTQRKRGEHGSFGWDPKYHSTTRNVTDAETRGPRHAGVYLG
jgi:hypothetical protein